MGKKGQYEYAYNGQISVDEKSQIIIGQHVSQNANDKKKWSPHLSRIRGRRGKLPDKMTMDNRYLSGANLEVLGQAEVNHTWPRAAEGR